MFKVCLIVMVSVVAYNSCFNDDVEVCSASRRDVKQIDTVFITRELIVTIRFINNLISRKF